MSFDAELDMSYPQNWKDFGKDIQADKKFHNHWYSHIGVDQLFRRDFWLSRKQSMCGVPEPAEKRRKRKMKLTMLLWDLGGQLVKLNFDYLMLQQKENNFGDNTQPQMLCFLLDN